MRHHEPHVWNVGDYLTHRLNPDLGVGRVVSTDRRSIVVEFSRQRASLRLAIQTDVLIHVRVSPGAPVRLIGSNEEVVVTTKNPDGTFLLADGRTVDATAMWPVELRGVMLDRFEHGDLDEAEDFILRLKMLNLLELREAQGLGPYLGGRVRLFPHQLYVAERASADAPIRWLLADEVGLGKTIEAALVLNRLVHSGTVERCLIVAPETLTIQWLGELWRKYHQVFTILDKARLADVEKDFGSRFNPFDVHRRAIVALEVLIEHPQLTADAVRAGIDVLVVDEAQRLRRPPGRPGDPAWRAVAPIAALGRHVLLLSATPLEDDAHGFFRLLQLLRPADFPEEVSVEARLTTGTPLPPCTSATRRVDIGGLPPRISVPVDLSNDEWLVHAEVERALRHQQAPNAVAVRKKTDRIRRALASGAALSAVLGHEVDLKRTSEGMDARDGRIAWLLANVPAWRAAGEKTLVFVAHRETLEMLRAVLSHQGQLATGVFHEDLSSARRDIEVARFRTSDGPSVLISTECGGEGRNFEFCRRLILYDLPWKPSTVEQRIGRLDRIGRTRPVEVIYFRPPGGLGLDVVRLFEALGLFQEPLAGVEPQLAHIEQALEDLATVPDVVLSDEDLDGLLAQARSARSRIREAAYQQLHREPYRASMAAGILARLPVDLDSRNEDVVVAMWERLGFTVQQPAGKSTYAVEIGAASTVDGLPGVPPGASFVGTFDREEAVERETLEFFASGHPLVEGLFAYFEDNGLGRVVRFEIQIASEEGEGLVAIYRGQTGFEVVAVDSSGALRADWADVVRRCEFSPRPLADPADRSRPWAPLVRRLASALPHGRRPDALASVVVNPLTAQAPARVGS